MATERRALLAAFPLLVLLLGALPETGDGRGSGRQAEDEAFAASRHQMVEEQIVGRDVRAPRVVAAMGEVPRHLFVPAARRALAYADTALPIGSGQTISQPYVVALMTSLLDLGPGARVLEVGTGSGYHAAVLSRLAGEVYTIEIVPELAARARRTLARLGYGNVHVRTGDGYRGWPEAAPFDAILLTAAPRQVPAPLLAQLKPGGRLVAPVGPPADAGAEQELVVLVKRAQGGVDTRRVLPVRFVSMTGEAQGRR
jgi:protein-L-isoaspartate(D-aspartate) O-methyltransferase